jgi:hypothetical protein
VVRLNRFFAAVTSSGAREVLIVLGCVALVIIVVLGIKNGWLDFQGRPIQHIRELQVPVGERNRQIDDLVKPSPTSTRGDS